MPPEIAALGPIRMPLAFADFGLRDYMAAACLGLLLALLIGAVLRPFLASRQSDLRRLRAELASYVHLPADERLFRQGQVAARFGRRLPDAGRAALYGGAEAVDLDAIDRQILALEHPPVRLKQPDRRAAAQTLESGAISYRPDDSVRSESALEHPPVRLKQPDRRAAAQTLESGAISYRPDDSVRSESAHAARRR